MRLIADAPRRTARRAGAALLAAVLAAVAFAIVSRLVVAGYRSSADGAGVPVLFDKLEALKTALPATDVVVVGSSHVYRNFDPASFDAAMAERGCPVRSYNMGVAGMNVNEANFIVDSLAGEHAPDWLLIENLPPVRPSSFGNERSRLFMRLDTLPLALRDILSASVSEQRRLLILSLVLYAHAYEEAGTGMLASRLIGDADLDDERRAFYAWGDSGATQGYLALEDERSAQFGARRQRHLDNLAPFERALARYAADDQQPENADKRLRFLRGVLDRVASTGPDVALVLMPNPQEGAFSRGLARGADRLGHPLINLNDPTRFPWLGSAESWFDPSHLNRGASERLSIALARDFCQLLQTD